MSRDQLRKAREGLAELRKLDPARADQAHALLVSLIEHAATALLDKLPPIYGNVHEDGAFHIEWLFEDRRLGFSFEVDPSESGWWWVTKTGDGASGPLNELDLEDLVRRVLD